MIHGLIVINKPQNITSHDVVDKVRKLFRIKKVGHFGTLDPMAEGILLIGMGKATKFFNFYMQKKKLYAGKIKFGFATTTYDCEGTPVSEKTAVDLTGIDITALMSGFTGKISQTPPIYSAKKVSGKPLYKYARARQEVEIKPVQVEIFSLTGKVLDKETLAFEAETSSGTYIRSLAHDMGQRLGVGAYLDQLTRVRIGEFGLQNAVTLEQMSQEVQAGNISAVVTPIEALLPEFPKIILNQGGRKAVLNGVAPGVKEILKMMSMERRENYRLFDEEGKLLAIAKKDDKSMRFRPYIVFPD